MNLAQKSMPADSRRLLDQHLDAIERVLAQSGLTRSERRTICDEVETQAIEMASSRADDELTTKVMESVIAELDPPEGYRQHDDSTSLTVVQMSQHPQKLSFFALGSIILPIIAVMLILSSNDAFGIFAILGGVSVISYLLATLAIRDMQHSPSRIGGLGFAVFGMLAIPLLVMNFLAFLLSVTISDEVTSPSIASYNKFRNVGSTVTAYAEQLKFAIAKAEQAADKLELDQAAKEEKVASDTDELREQLNKLMAEYNSLVPTAWDRNLFQAQYAIMTALVASFLTVSGAVSVFIYRLVYRHYLNQPATTNPVAMLA